MCEFIETVGQSGPGSALPLSCRTGEVHELASDRAGAISLQVPGDAGTAGEDVAAAELHQFATVLMPPLQLQSVEVIEDTVEA